MGDGQGPEKLNDTCRKTMHRGTMDRGVTVFRIFCQLGDQLSWSRYFVVFLSPSRQM